MATLGTSMAIYDYVECPKIAWPTRVKVDTGWHNAFALSEPGDESLVPHQALPAICALCALACCPCLCVDAVEPIGRRFIAVVDEVTHRRRFYRPADRSAARSCHPLRRPRCRQIP